MPNLWGIITYFHNFVQKSISPVHIRHIDDNQSFIKFKKFRSRLAHHNYLREKNKIKFTGISELDLSFQLTMIWCELKFMASSQRDKNPSIGRKEYLELLHCSSLLGVHCTTLDLTMSLSSHQIIVSWKERSSSDMPVNLILIFFSSSSKYLNWSVNFRSVLICYTTLIL